MGGKVNETVKKYPVAKIMISYLSSRIVKLFQFFFGFKR